MSQATVQGPRSNHLSIEHSQYMLAHVIRDRQLFEYLKAKIREGDFIHPDHNLTWTEVTKCFNECGELPNHEYLTLNLYLTSMLAEKKEAGVKKYVADLFAHELMEPKAALPKILGWLELARRNQYLRSITSSTPTSVLIEDLSNIQACYTPITERSFLDPFNRFTGLSKFQVVPLGLKGFDRRISCGGVPKRRNVLLLSGTSGGKTTFLTNIAVNSAKNRYHSLFISLEDPEDELATRIYACAAQLPHSELLFLESRTNEHVKRLEELRPSMEHYIHLYDVEKDMEKHGSILTSFTPDDLDRVIGDFLETHNHKLDIVLVDYLNLIASDPSLPETEQAKDVTTRLKRISRKYDIVMVVTAQTNRTGLLKSVVDIGDMAGFFNASWGFDYILGFGNAEEEQEAQNIADNYGVGFPEQPKRLLMNIAKGKMMAKHKFYVDADFAYMTIREV